jgi:hypothetical protein
MRIISYKFNMKCFPLNKFKIYIGLLRTSQDHVSRRKKIQITSRSAPIFLRAKKKTESTTEGKKEIG